MDSRFFWLPRETRLMSFVAFMLKRPYTVISGLILIALLGIGAVSRMPVDIFPEIDIPVGPDRHCLRH